MPYADLCRGFDDRGEERIARFRVGDAQRALPPSEGIVALVAAGSPGARSIGYGLWFLRLQPFEDGLQGVDLRR